LAKGEAGLSNGIFSIIASGASNVSEDDLFDFLKDLSPFDLVFKYFHSILNLSVGLVDRIPFWVDDMVQIIHHFR
jgi:hypothetical protein